ncbi:hypothetical protein HY523_01755, partial [Candidatus Berkelbacteria bacterium]|nr:hypothetical protein [Candidatus Berkelbacteria bacterium]
MRKIGLVVEETIREAIQNLVSQDGGLPTIPPQRDPAQAVADYLPADATRQALQAGRLQAWLQANIDAVAVTAGPGLIGSLLVGVNTAKALAYALEKPLLGVNHHEGHIAAAWLDHPATERIGALVPLFPALALVVSGGHTLLVEMPASGQFVILGRTRDDAAGEAFDKVARLLGLPYPGGPSIEALAAADYRLQTTDYR